MRHYLKLWAYIVASYFLICIVTTFAGVAIADITMPAQMRQERDERFAAIKAELLDLTTAYHANVNELQHADAETVPRIKRSIERIRSELNDLIVTAPYGLKLGDALEILRN